jgi:hypothetical protein
VFLVSFCCFFLFFVVFGTQFCGCSVLFLGSLGIQILDSEV